MRARQLWGNDIYTQDSDLVAVLMHLGYYNHTITTPHPSVNEVCSPLAGCMELHVMLKMQAAL